jgi:hypothetical protein
MIYTGCMPEPSGAGLSISVATRLGGSQASLLQHSSSRPLVASLRLGSACEDTDTTRDDRGSDEPDNKNTDKAPALPLGSSELLLLSSPAFLFLPPGQLSWASMRVPLKQCPSKATCAVSRLKAVANSEGPQ